MTLSKRILAVDDEPNMRRLLEISLKQAGYQAIPAQDGYEALAILRSTGADLMVSDLHMPGMDGLRLLETMRQEGIEIPVIIVTAQGEVTSAVQAMKMGAADYILRPFDLATLEIAIERALSITKLKQENQFLRAEVALAEDTLIGSSPAMAKLKQAIQQVAPEKATALLVGETGSGKELVAQAIHQQSSRAQALFVAVNCAAIPGEMLESELFGHERGAFTGAIKQKIGKFELADGGTLFLDEITEMPIALQAKLLRALQQSSIERLGGNRAIDLDMRVIAATNRDPVQAIKMGLLREDLYYRLNVFRIDLPPLRERIEDIAMLSQHFLARKNKQITAAALHVLQSYAWPGNVRELENVLERAAIVCGAAAIDIMHLPQEMLPADIALTALPLSDAAPQADAMDLPAATRQLEIQLIQQALQQSEGNKSRAARLLNISERSLWYKLQTYQLK